MANIFSPLTNIISNQSTCRSIRRMKLSSFSSRNLLEKRRKDCEGLPDSELHGIVDEPWQELLSRISPPAHISSPADRFIYLLENLLADAEAKEGVPASARRAAFTRLKDLLSKLEALVKKLKSRPKNSGAVAANPSGTVDTDGGTEHSSCEHTQDSTHSSQANSSRGTQRPPPMSTNDITSGRQSVNGESAVSSEGVANEGSAFFSHVPGADKSLPPKSCSSGSSRESVGLDKLQKSKEVPQKSLLRDSGTNENPANVAQQHSSSTGGQQASKEVARQQHGRGVQEEIPKSGQDGPSLQANGHHSRHKKARTANSTRDAFVQQSQSSIAPIDSRKGTSPHPNTIHVAPSNYSNSYSSLASEFQPPKSKVVGRAARIMQGGKNLEKTSTNLQVAAAASISNRGSAGNGVSSKSSTSPTASEPKTDAKKKSEHAAELQNLALNFVRFYGGARANRLRLHFPPDVARMGFLKPSCAVNERTERMSTEIEPCLLTDNVARDIHDRLVRWDPFWRPMAYIAMGTTSKVSSCTPQLDAGSTAASIRLFQNFLVTLKGSTKAVQLCDIPGLDVAKAKAELKSWDIRLIMRMLPVDPPKKKRADVHQWPQGTFMHIKEEPITITQRKQQKHDLSEWKGMSDGLDLGPHLSKQKEPFSLDMCCYDTDLFHYSVALCQYRSSDTLFSLLVGNGAESLDRLSVVDGQAMATAYAQGQMVVLDESDGEAEEDASRFVFSLCCPISKSPMVTPVRSPNCKHFGCFDLKNFIYSNSHVTGSRWRCGGCERFVSLDELQICEFTSKLLEEFKDSVSSSRDRIEFSANQSYRLLMEQRKRYNKRPTDSVESESHPDAKKAKVQAEVIELL